MKDISPSISIGIPVGSLLLCIIVAIIDTNLYLKYILLDEGGYLEHSTILFLLPAVGMSFWMFRHRAKFPSKILGLWCFLLFLGSLYYALEECSWGQNYFQWATPEWMMSLNDQGETNIHNTSNLFDHVPRLILNILTIVCMISSVALYRKRKSWNPRQDWREWAWPTLATFTAALVTGLVGLPQKFYGDYDIKHEMIPDWFDVIFLRGNHSELKEHFLAIFIFMYVASMFWRFRSLFHEGPSAVVSDQKGQNQTAP